MDEEGVFIFRNGIHREGGEEPREVRGAARAAEPFAADRVDVAFARILVAGGRHYLERVHIEEAFAVEGDAGEDAVVELALEDVGVAGVGIEGEHAAREEGHADGRAGLGIGGVVRQVVIEGKCLADLGAAQAPGDVHFLAGHVVPEGLAGIFQGFIAENAREVGHSRVEVDGPDGVPDGLGLLPHRQMRLQVAVGDPLPVIAFDIPG